MASWGCWISVYDSSGEPAGRPECSRANFTEPFGSEFEVGGATSECEVRKRAFKKGGLMDILESWFLSLFFSLSPFMCIHVLATSLCLGVNEERPVRFVQEKISTGVESENQIRLKKAIVRRRLAPLSKGRDCKERSFLYQCWSEPHFLEAGFWWG